MKYLITGGCGFLGSNIVNELMSNNEEKSVIIFDNLSREGSISNLKWLEKKGNFTFINGDISNIDDITKCIKDHLPDFIFHLAGQVAMTTSIEDPELDFNTNALGTFYLLNAAKKYSPSSKIIYSSTNKVYGDLKNYKYSENSSRYLCIDRMNGFNETERLNFHSPYGNSKGCGDQYMLDFNRIYGLKTLVFRHSSIYGYRQFATFDQGWVGWFISQGINQLKNRDSKQFTISGNGKQVRDLLHSKDAIELYLRSCKYFDKIYGHAYNIGGGIENSCSILELIRIIEKELNIKLKYKKIEERISDQKVFIADNRKISSKINWKPTTSKIDGIKQMISWQLQNFANETS